MVTLELGAPGDAKARSPLTIEVGRINWSLAPCQGCHNQHSEVIRIHFPTEYMESYTEYLIFSCGYQFKRVTYKGTTEVIPA